MSYLLLTNSISSLISLPFSPFPPPPLPPQSKKSSNDNANQAKVLEGKENREMGRRGDIWAIVEGRRQWRRMKSGEVNKGWERGREDEGK
jgi:hypothetical protein